VRSDGSVDSESVAWVKAVGRPSLVLGAAALSLGGAVFARGYPLAAHLAIVVGMIVFGACARMLAPARTAPPLAEWMPSSRLPLAGVAMLAIAGTACIAGASDRFVLVAWLAGILVLGAGIAFSRLRALRTARPPRASAALAVVSVVGLAVAVNFHQLAKIPIDVHGDVGEIALVALEMDVSRDLFRTSTRWWGVPGMHNALQRIGFWFADGLAGARATDALWGVLAVLPMIAIVQPVTGLAAALLAAVLAVGSENMINTWRSGLALGPPPLLTLIATWALLRGVESERSPRDFFLITGVCAGLALQVNLAARVIPLMLGCFALHELVFGTRATRRRIFVGFSWTVICAVLVAAPILWFYVQYPETIQPRAEKFILSDSTFRVAQRQYGTSSTLGVLWNQMVRSVGMFHYFPEGENVGFFRIERSFFEPITAAFLFLGVAGALRRFRERRFAWPLGGCVISVLLLAATIYAPSYHRAGPAAVLALVLVGFGAGGLLEAVGRLGERLGGRRIGVVSVAVVGVCLAIVGVHSGVSAYRIDYGEQEGMLTMQTELARRIAAEPRESSRTFLLGAPMTYFNHGDIRFLARGYEGRDVAPDAAPPRRSELREGVNLFLAVPRRVAELRAIARSLPPGTWEDHYSKSAPRRHLFSVLRIVVPPR
jgi:hypothetical protein